MVERTIIWTKTAAKQRRLVLKYWTKRNHSPTYSKKLLAVITEKLAVISQNPKMYKAADFENTHVAAMGHFSIFYTPMPDKIIVTAFWDNRQDPEKLITELSK